MSKIYAVDESKLTAIADKIRIKTGSSDSMSIDDMPSKIDSISGGSSDDSYTPTEWVRPSEWPNLDLIDLTNEEAMYYTVDCTHAKELKTLHNTDMPICWTTKMPSGGYFTIELGHVDSSGFVVDEVIGNVSTNNAILTNVCTTRGNYVVYRLRPTVGHLSLIEFCRVDGYDGLTSEINDTMATCHCVEMYGSLPYATDSISRGWAYRTFATPTTERIKVNFASTSTISNLSASFQNCRSLKSIDFSGWDTSNWTVNNMTNMFSGCNSLESADMSGFNTSKWRVTNLSNMFSNCFSLGKIDMSGWDTTNWAVTNMTNLFYLCSSLVSIDLSSWDTTNWAVTTLQSMFSTCTRLSSIKGMGSFVTTNWRVTSLASMFLSCKRIKKVDFSGWNTRLWTVNNLSNVFDDCGSLEFVDFSGWDTSNWAVTNLYRMFNNCGSLTDLGKFQELNVSNWAVTTMQEMFNNCYALPTADFSSWDTSNWSVTNISGLFYNCRSLKSIDVSFDTYNWAVTSLLNVFNSTLSLSKLSGLDLWDTTNWAVTTLQQMFYRCNAREIDISGWDTSNWAVTNMSSMFNDSGAIYIDMSNWDTSKWVVTNASYAFYMCKNLYKLDLTGLDMSKFTGGLQISDCPALRVINPPTSFPGKSQSIGSYCTLLTVESLVGILNALPTVTSATTLTMRSPNKNKLSAEQLAIATGKGWTIS